jgi:photosystem II stability/assembly factor-like uncharacterized protein
LTFSAVATALLAMIPAACKRPAPPEPSAPTIEFLTDSFDLDGIGWMSEQTDESGVALDVSGLCAIDKDVAFLFGGLRVPAGTIRSFLLRTADGGMTWHEVMPAVLGSDVTHVAFSDDLHGWALAIWTVEGPGTMLLSGSRDGGRTWRQLTEIQRSEGHAVPDGWPLSMTFVDASKGEIAIAYDGESASVDDLSQVVETLVSDDGGLSWNMVRRETRAVPPEEAPPANEPSCNTTDWVLEVPSVDEQSITVRRFDRQRNRWLSMTLPRHFQYERGRVVSSR